MDMTPEVDQLVAASAVAVTTDALPFHLVPDGRNMLNVGIDNASGFDMTTLVIQKQDDATGDFYDYFGGTDWGNATDKRIEFVTSQRPDLTPNGQKSHATIIVGRPYAVRAKLTLANAGNVRVRLSA